MALDQHVAALISTAAAGLLMALAGVTKNGLEWRHRRRVCPSCGRVVRDDACACRS